MRVIHSPANALTPIKAALGNFDGVHRGHRQVINPVLRSSNLSAYPTVVTFHPHPQEFFSGQSRLLLTPLAEKVQQLQEIGVEQLLLLPFDRQLACLSPEAFVEDILVGQLQVKQVSVGQNFCFGKQRRGTAIDLQTIAARYGVDVTIVALETLRNERVSSSAIREALQAGDLTLANRLLGRPYTLIGEVVLGQQLGRTLGFPTANLQLPPEKFLPRRGVYGVRVEVAKAELPTRLADLDGEILPSQNCPQSLWGVMNLGYRPTVSGTQQVAEVHLLDWSGDLYGTTLTVHLETFVRPEQKFVSLDALKAQIQIDCDTARQILAAIP